MRIGQGDSVVSATVVDPKTEQEMPVGELDGHLS
jgi:hypothetical protein